QGVGVKHQIDTVWHPAEAISREDGDPALEALKILCGLNPADRQSKQEGQFQARYKEQLYPGVFLSQGTPTGERVVLQLTTKGVRFKTLAELGVRDKIQEAIQEAMNRPKGLVLLSAMPGGGLRTTTDVLLRNQDRFLREFLAVEDVQHRYDEIENIPVHTYDSSKGETPASILQKVFRLYPNVIVIRDLVNGETIKMLCAQMEKEDQLGAVSTIRAKECAEALLRVLALKAPQAEFAAYVNGVLNQRLIRKLCDKCKQAYQPTPQVLQQLGFPAGKALTFYRPPQPTPEQPTIEPCEQCGGIGYYGLTGLFEWWTIDDTIRKVLTAAPKLDLLRKAAQKAGMRTMQEEGLLLVAKGVTSLQELSRVMKL
ncbi:MAG TPA: ATPase, T2SS/T4P/T4SS family, partial [Thermoguttaceae bacterium]|nr:ATPase, T2SS/T4P/T4SS family [Thermoguttaceae bacterium]